MKKKMMIVMAAIIMSLFITGFKSNAAEITDYYTIVKNGVYNDIQAMQEEETESQIVISVRVNECVSEKICVYDVRFVSDGEVYRLWVYLDKYQDEVIAITYDSDGEVYDQGRMSLEEAAEAYI